MLGAVPPLKRGSDFSLTLSQRLRAGLMNTAVPAGARLRQDGPIGRAVDGCAPFRLVNG